MSHRRIVTPERLRTFHLIMTVFWTLMIVPSILWWKDSVLWVIVLSVWANLASHFAAWQASRGEIVQRENGSE